MSDNPRDTKFAGFAQLLWEDITNKLDFWIDTSEPNFTEEIKQIFAQRAYDLVEHAFTDIDYRVEYVPDLTQWPDLPDSE